MVPWKRALAMLEFGEADLTTTISRQSDRDRYLVWSLGYRSGVRYHFYGRSGAGQTLKALDGLDGKTLGITLGYFYPEAITKRPGLSIETGNDIATTVRMLNAGRTDFIVVNGVAGAWEIQRQGLATQLERQPFTFSSDSATYMAFSKARPHAQALAAMNAGLEAMARDGSIARIEKKYVK